MAVTRFHGPIKMADAAMLATLVAVNPPVAQMLALVHALTLDDLRVLAAFPSHPHRSIHLLLAMIYLVLHDTRDAPPPTLYTLTWAFLRQSLLAQCSHLLRQLQQQHRSRLSPTTTQLCLVYLVDPAFRIDALRKVSAIAAALASWVVLALTKEMPRRESDSLGVETATPSTSSARHRCHVVCRLVHPHTRSIKYIVHVMCSSHEATISFLGCHEATSSVVVSVTRSHPRFLAWFLHVSAFPPLALCSWMHHLLSSVARQDALPWQIFAPPPPAALSLPRRLPTSIPLRLYFVVVTPPNLVGLGLLLVDATTSLCACRDAFATQLGLGAASFYFRGARVGRHMERKMDARRLLPVALLLEDPVSSPPATRKASVAAVQTALALLDRVQRALSLGAAVHKVDASTVTLPLVKYCAVARPLTDPPDDTVAQLTGLLNLWTSDGHERVIESCGGTSNQRGTFQQLQLDRIAPQSIDPFKRMHQERQYYDAALPKLKRLLATKHEPLAHEMQKIAQSLNILTAADVATSALLDPAPPKVIKYRALPLFESIALELEEQSETNERYECTFMTSPVPAATTALLIDGATVRLNSGEDVIVASGWSDETATFHVAKPVGRPCPSISNLWLVVDASCDKRPQWLHDVQCFVHHPTFEFNDSALTYRIFRITLSYRVPEVVLEGQLWSKDVDWVPYVEKTPCSAIVDTKFSELCETFPSNNFIDSVKFSKFIRDCDVSPKKLPMGTLDAIFYRHSILRFQMDLDGFRAALALVVEHLYKSKRLANPLLQFFMYQMILSPSMSGIWKHTMDTYRFAAKMQCMDALAHRICAASRIQAAFRGFVVYGQFKDHWAMVRWRRRAATTIICCFKRLYCMRLFVGMKREAAIQRAIEVARLARLAAEEAAQKFLVDMHVRLQVWVKYRLWKKRRFRRLHPEWIAHKQRMRTRKRHFMARLAAYIDGRLFLVSVFRSHIDQAKDPRLHFELYCPDDSTTLVLDVHETTTQDIWAAVADRDKPDPTHLRSRIDMVLGRVVVNHVVRRAKLRLADDRCAAGCLMARFAGKDECGHYMLASLYMRHFRFGVLGYAPSTCSHVKWTVDACFLYRIVQFAQWSSHVTWHCCSSVSFDQDCTELMECRRRLCHLLACPCLRDLARLHFFRSLLHHLTKYGPTTFPSPTMLIPTTFHTDVAEEMQRRRVSAASLYIHRRFRAAVQIQATWRATRARHAFKSLVQTCYDIYFDRSARHLWYESRVTGRRFPRPPFHRLLHVVYPAPLDEWLPQCHADGSVYYFNPAHGATSWFNLDTVLMFQQGWTLTRPRQAARKVQRVFRRRRQDAIGRLTLRNVAAALAYHRSVPATTVLTSAEKLRSALHHHTVTHDFDRAMALYDQVLREPTDETGVASACLGMLLLVTGRPPWKKNQLRAQDLLEAAARDPRGLECAAQMEVTCFRWAALLAPSDGMSLAIYALFVEHILGDIDRAETLYRRALALIPEHARTMENYTRLMEARTPTGRYAAAGPGKVMHQRSYVVSTAGEWEEHVDGQTQSRFWFNSTTKTLQWAAPSLEPAGDADDEDGCSDSIVRFRGLWKMAFASSLFRQSMHRQVRPSATGRCLFHGKRSTWEDSSTAVDMQKSTQVVQANDAITEVVFGGNVAFCCTESGAGFALFLHTNTKLNISSKEHIQSMYYNALNESLVVIASDDAVSENAPLHYRSLHKTLVWRNPPVLGIRLFPDESLQWPGFVEFDQANGKILTASYSTTSMVYKVWDLRTYEWLYTLQTDGRPVREIKTSPRVLSIRWKSKRRCKRLPLTVLAIDTGEVFLDVSLSVPSDRIEFVELFEEKLFLKQANHALCILDVRQGTTLVSVVAATIDIPSSNFVFLYESKVFLVLQEDGASMRMFDFQGHLILDKPPKKATTHDDPSRLLSPRHPRHAGCIFVVDFLQSRLVASSATQRASNQHLRSMTCFAFNHETHEVFTGHAGGAIAMWSAWR
ncbi:Aste57867_18281 [Aphanomyces stellatus]|uniref:Aste57867_18281 protein n=1 Tax=Aphanomyces stellatus TaxID=120398 RepID=A0A485L9P0_9STRA|nr:hypothetical protein As57867_018219 [Aphanomyces stellatus]VFT95018.1 Aste57867_18281 [Aphanomyces stellatus]